MVIGELMPNMEHCINCTNSTLSISNTEPNLWCLVLVLFPISCIFGNVLVVLAVLSERSLKTSTNFLLVSLACADLIIGSLVMPFSIYLTINRLQWFLPEPVCNFFCVVDVSASTSSIVHLVAISIDRFYAVVRHMEYKSPKHKRRVYCTIVFSWTFSIGIGFPLGIGLNHGSKEVHECGIINPDYMLYSSIFAFYIPCLVMTIMYGFVFYKLHRRMKAIRLQEMAAGQMVQFGDNLSNILEHAYGNKQNLRQASLIWAIPFLKTLEETIAENEDMSTDDWDELTTILHTLESDSHHASALEPMEEIPESPEHSDHSRAHSTGSNQPAINRLLSSSITRRPPRRKGRLMNMFYSMSDPRNRRRKQFRRSNKTRLNHTISDVLASVVGVSPSSGGNGIPTKSATSPGGRSDSERRRRRSIYAAKRKIRTLKERAIELLMKLKSKQGMLIRKETRATKLVATVMLVFLLCWTPFFTLNIVKVSKLRADTWNYELESLFIFFTWLGYLNSCLNPIIYSLFNRKFRATFQKLLHWPREDTQSPLGRRRRLYSRPFAGDPPGDRRGWLPLSQRYSLSPRKTGAKQQQLFTNPSTARRNGPVMNTRSLPPMTTSYKRPSAVPQRPGETVRPRKITWGTGERPTVATAVERSKSLDQENMHIATGREDIEKEEVENDKKVPSEQQNGTENELLRRIQSLRYTQPKQDSFTEPVEV